ncbi:MAG: type I glutamate--ammonia ligase [Candidatus Zixiibacteriota bacterium]|nr:MAG: type I glutamate--ammonia ligase [candidate division Zixibacteria bacterium]
MPSLANLQKTIKQKKIEYIDLKFCDLIGEWHHITIPAYSVNQDLFKNGVGVDGSSLPGFAKIERGDMIILPDADKLFLDPFFEKPTLSFICDIMSVNKEIEQYSRNPRWVLIHADKYLKKILPGVDAILGPEFEFYLFDSVVFRQVPQEGYYFLDSEEADWNTGIEDGKNLAYKVPYKGGYHAAPPKDRTFNLRSEISTLLSDVGIKIKYHHHEVGGGGQHEIEIDLDEMVKMGDTTMLIKYIVKNHAFRCGKSATFMPKPLFKEPGSGMHVHQYLADKKGSVFYDMKGPSKFSKVGLHYIGGLLKHAAALFAFTNPSTNSYKRLVPGFEAPVYGTYSMGNRTACIRIPGYQRRPQTHRMEFRPPDATANPYLAYAAMVMAGLDGIKNKIDPGDPVDKDLSVLPEAELKKIPLLPTSLTKALDALEKDYKFLLAGGVFTKDLIEAWIKLKRRDVEEIRIRPHPWEFELYYDK